MASTNTSEAILGILLKHHENIIYPIQAFPTGYIYISYNNTSPAEMFGGSWAQITDKFLLSAGDIYAINTTGGSETVTLTTAQLPSHAHSATAYFTTGGYDNSGVWELAQKHSNVFDNITTTSAGRGAAHNNMPPYTTVFMWEKIGEE